METTEREKQIQELLARFDDLKGTKFVGIRNYKSNKTGEVANFVVNANFNYGNAVKRSIEILNNLSEEDFRAIAEKYTVYNEAGILYPTNKGAEKYLTEGKLPKEGTKARTTALAGVKKTKTLSTIRDEWVQSLIDNQDEETRSVQSKAQTESYTRMAKGVKKHMENGLLYIWAMSQDKKIIEEGEYKKTNPTVEGAQKIAIERYCRKVLNNELPISKYRSFRIEQNQLTDVVITGDTFSLV